MKNKVCYIVGACSESFPYKINKSKGDLIIAADGGYDALKKISIQPDIILGDFDSISEIPNCNVIKFPVEKDDTDIFLSYKLGHERGYKNYVIYGGIGGRLDHTIANLQLLTHISKSNEIGFLIGRECVITAIHNSKIELPQKNNGTISVFSHGEKATGVCIKGLKYSIENGELTNSFPLGVSNEFINKNAVISVDNGTLQILWQDLQENFLTYFKDLLI